MKKLQHYPFLFFLLVALILRMFSFHFSVIDHDESTYMVIANQLLKGDVLYVDIWDTKPPGIFLLFALVIKVFGNSIIPIRLFATFVLAVSAWSLFNIKKKLAGSQSVSLLAGVVYILLMSCYRFGMAANTEIFYECTVIVGLYFYVVRGKSFIAGLIWGVAYVIKFVVLFDLLAIWLALALVWLISKERFNLKVWVQRHITIALGFAIPFGFCLLFYWQIGRLDDFIHASFVIPSRYSTELELLRVLDYIGNLHVKFLPFMLLFYTVLINQVRQLKWKTSNVLLPLFWFLLAWIVVILPGKYFDHYYLQLALPIAWVVADVLLMEWRLVSYFNAHKRRISLLLVVFILGLIWGNQSYFFTQKDEAREVAKILEENITTEDKIYAGNRLQVLYFLLDNDPPTKYVHPSLLTFDSHVKTLNIDPDEEFRAIFEQQPKFCLLKEKIENSYFNNRLAEEYELKQTIGRVGIYTRKY